MMQIIDYLHDDILRNLAGRASIVIGLSGPQGSGKTTLCNLLRDRFGARCAVLALDDFYLPKADRLRLAEHCSPLFKTRGPPGTHDIGFLRDTLGHLKALAPGSRVQLPVFSKRRDDREPMENWQTLTSKPDIIIIEGWCIGAQDIPDYQALAPLNDAERCDGDQAWLSYQRAQLSTAYADMWREIDMFYHLQAPSFETVLQWRTQQEATNLSVPLDALSDARKAWVSDFLQYYERITRAMADGHRRPGKVLQLSATRELLSMTLP